jgi:hypothetical protein
LNVSEVAPFSGIVSAPKVLVICGGLATVRFADAVRPVPLLVEVTLPVVLVYWPDAAPVTVTLNTHWLLTAIVAPVRVIPVGDVVVRVPPHGLEELVATVRPVGSVSVKATPASACVLADGFVSVNSREVVPFREIVLGLKAVAIVGGATTNSCAVLLVAPIPPSVEVIAPVVLFFVPAAVPVTLTEKVQEDPAAGDAVNVPLDKVMAPLPAFAVIVLLPQEPVIFGVAATTTPAGKLSTKATPLNVLALFGLVIVKLKVLLAFNATLVGLNVLLSVAGPTTVREVLEVLPVPASVSLTATLLGANPATVPCTFKEIVQDAPAARFAPVKVMLPEPAVAAGVVLQVLLKPLGEATTSVPVE